MFHVCFWSVPPTILISHVAYFSPICTMYVFMYVCMYLDVKICACVLHSELRSCFLFALFIIRSTLCSKYCENDTDFNGIS